MGQRPSSAAPGGYLKRWSGRNLVMARAIRRTKQVLALSMLVMSCRHPHATKCHHPPAWFCSPTNPTTRIHIEHRHTLLLDEVRHAQRPSSWLLRCEPLTHRKLVANLPTRTLWERLGFHISFFQSARGGVLTVYGFGFQTGRAFELLPLLIFNIAHLC